MKSEQIKFWSKASPGFFRIESFSHEWKINSLSYRFHFKSHKFCMDFTVFVDRVLPDIWIYNIINKTPQHFLSRHTEWVICHQVKDYSGHTGELISGIPSQGNVPVQT